MRSQPCRSPARSSRSEAEWFAAGSSPPPSRRSCPNHGEAAGILPARRDARLADRADGGLYGIGLAIALARRLERAAVVPGRRRVERHRVAAARQDGRRRCRARARLRRCHHGHGTQGPGVRRHLHGRAAGEPRLRVPGGRARRRAREASRRAVLRPATRPRLLRRMLDGRPRRHVDGAALPDLLRRHRGRSAGDAHQLLAHRRRVGRNDAERGCAQGRVGQAGYPPSLVRHGP